MDRVSSSSSSSSSSSVSFSMMPPYQPHTMHVGSEVTNVTKKSFELLGKMDKVNRKLSRSLDEKIKNIRLKKRPRAEELHLTDMLRRAVETIAAEKVQLATKSYDIIDQNIKIVDNEILLLEKALIESGEMVVVDETVGNVVSASDKGSYKKKKHEKKIDQLLAMDSNVDPNEPVYCICNRIAFGDMIACDNEECPIEWFHYTCVNLTRKPRNSWICPTCSSRRKK